MVLIKLAKYLLAAGLLSVSMGAVGQTDQGSGDTRAGESTDMSPIPDGAVSTYDDIKYGSKGTGDGLYLGLGLGFGQARSTEPESSPGLSTMFSLEPGYVFGRGSWSRLELSLQLFSGVMEARMNDGHEVEGKWSFPVGLGALGRFGYGVSLGGGVMGVTRLGVGPVMAKPEVDGDGFKGKSSSSTGILAQLGYHIVMPANDTFEFTGGFSWSHVQFDVDKVKVDGSDVDVDRTFVLNIPQFELGGRIRF